MNIALFRLLTYLLLLSFDGRLALSVAEVAALLGLSERHVWAQLKAGAIPSIRLGRRVLIPVSGLEQLLGREEVEDAEFRSSSSEGPTPVPEGEATVADLLVETHPCCTSCGRKSVDRFKKLAVRMHGSWFEEALASRPEDLSDADSLYVSVTWDQWRADEDPFRVRRRR